MDVKCERCNTEYEFDDALVSGRGTTVKCTNCGHKFKIRRGDGELADDYWNVTTGDGRTLVFTSLRELQRAIQGYLVERTDRLSRGGLPPKAIGQIPELAPFFDQREATKKGATGASNRSVKTQDGLGPGQAAVVAAAGGEVRPRQATRPDFPPQSEPLGDEHAGDKGKSTLIGTGPLSDQEAIPRPGPAALPRPKSTPPPVPAAGRAPMHTQPLKRPSLPPTPGAPPPVPGSSSSSPKPPVPEKKSAPPVPPPKQVSAPPPPPVAATTPQVVIRTNPPPAPPVPKPERAAGKTSTPPPPVPTRAVEPEPPARPRSLLAEIEGERRGRAGYESIPDLGEIDRPRRRPVGGFIVATVVLAGLLTMAAFWAQKILGAFTSKPPVTPAPTVDPRVAEFLIAGEKALADGNLVDAKGNFDHAHALAEKDPHVLLALARHAAVSADGPWLRQRLLAPDAVDEQRIAKSDLADAAAAARKAADAALAVAPEDPAAIRAKIDSLRIAEDRDGARALVPKISSSQSQPESAYVLAALDLSEAEPTLWSTINERLRTASSTETGPGRARAALIYALARSGDVIGAKAELDRLTAMTRTHPLLPLLRAYASNAKPKAADAGATFADTTSDGGQRPGTKPVTGTGTGTGVAAIPGDPREMLMQADKAKNKGDFERAKTLYNAALEKNPNDSEAIGGLAAIAYAQRDLEGARSQYKRALGINPNYLPAIIGLADVEWDSGNKDGAAKMYKEIVDRYPESSYPARAKQRSEGGGG